MSKNTHTHGTGIFYHECACQSGPACYRIIRFHEDGRPRTIRNGVTLADAQAHCSDPKTHGPGWFDGYDLMKGVKR
jgi:hypothetical protein